MCDRKGCPSCCDPSTFRWSSWLVAGGRRDPTRTSGRYASSSEPATQMKHGVNKKQTTRTRPSWSMNFNRNTACESPARLGRCQSEH
eukprot:scaffold11567_cov31-Tisochrysis_lutea.AAC.8